MATTEELLARIAELEAENAVLRDGKSGKPFLPKELREKYPWARAVGDTGKLFCDPISKAIRGMCFPLSTKERQFHNQHTKQSYKTNASYLVRLCDMTNEQYAKYSDCIAAVLKAFEPYLDSRFTGGSDG